MRQQGLTHAFSEVYGHRTHGEKMLHAPEPWQQVKPGPMKGGAYRHEVRLAGERAPKDTAKTLIIRHFANAMMVDDHGEA
jgi:hypothetical protein